ncbi:hypothetical protein E3U43_003147, partial [Larimichthys crocea]
GSSTLLLVGLLEETIQRRRCGGNSGRRGSRDSHLHTDGGRRGEKEGGTHT